MDKFSAFIPEPYQDKHIENFAALRLKNKPGPRFKFRLTA
jgi:hypothetical protein